MSDLLRVHKGCMEFSVRVSVCSSSGASSMTLPSASFGFSLVVKSMVIG